MNQTNDRPRGRDRPVKHDECKLNLLQRLLFFWENHIQLFVSNITKRDIRQKVSILTDLRNQVSFGKLKRKLNGGEGETLVLSSTLYDVWGLCLYFKREQTLIVLQSEVVSVYSGNKTHMVGPSPVLFCGTIPPPCGKM